MRKITTILLLCLSATLMQAQITIGGSIYGGGNAGDTGGSSKVTVYSGNLHAVFAGARMANIGGSSFIHLDGEHASDYILIDYVYGGNDIAGTIGRSATLPSELTKVGTTADLNKIDSTWNAFVRISTKMDGDDEDSLAQKIYVGQLFGGGNGYYTYEAKTSGTGTIVKDRVTGAVVDSSSVTLSSPTLGKTYLELLGGSIVYAYGGGNDATITDKTVICLDNPSEVVSSIKTGSGWYSQPSDGLKIALNAPTDAAYVAILLKKKTGETITLDDVRSSGITITSDTVITSAQISTFITGTDLGDYVSWAEMKADNISFEFTKEWRVGVKGKGTVMKLDTDGNLMIAGTFSQNVAIDGIRTSSDGTIERYNPNTGWTTMFAARYVRYVSSTTYLNKDDDYVIAGNGTFDIYLPSGSKNGKIISIKNLNDGIIVRAQGSDKIVQFDSNNAAQWKDLDNYDRAELVYYNQKWYWNYMEV